MPTSVVTAFVFACLFFLVSGILYIIGLVKAKQCTSVAPAVIDDIKNNNGLTTYVFKYNIDGHEYIREHKTGTTNNTYKLGDTLTVKYDPTLPTRIIPDKKNNIYTYAIAFLILGGICLVSGCCFYLPGVGNVVGNVMD